MKNVFTSKLLLSVFLFSALSAHAESKLSGTIKIDGSSTVYPITEAVAEEFRSVQSDVNVTVGISGTGGGMKKFTTKELDISNASRPIKAVEVEAAQKNGVEFVELPVAYDALTIVVNAKNDWAESITVQELKKLWEPEAQGKITKWSQIREGWPDKPIKLFGAGVDSGTYDYFTEAVVGKEHSSRGDFTSSEDDNVLVQGIANDLYALGFFGMAYYEENESKLKALKVDDGNPANGDGAQDPSFQNVVSGAYAPLSRPLFIYVSKAALQKKEVNALAEFYLDSVSKLAGEVGYVPLKDSTYAMVKKRLESRTTGSIYASVTSHVGLQLEELLKKSVGH